jgi:hypothetical protein
MFEVKADLIRDICKDWDRRIRIAPLDPRLLLD